jgi:hypothetical protein
MTVGLWIQTALDLNLRGLGLDLCVLRVKSLSSLCEARRSGVDVEPVSADESREALLVRAGELDREARGRGDARDDRHASGEGFLDDFERRAAAHEKDVTVERQPAAAQRVAEHFVDCVVPADILACGEQIPVGVEKRRGVQPAGLTKGSLRIRERVGKRVKHAGVMCTASIDALPQRPQLVALKT